MLEKLISSNKYILQTTMFIWLITKCICFKLWFTNRLFPLVPVCQWFHQIPAFIHTLLFVLSTLLMLLLMLKPTYKWAMAVLIVLEIASCLLDQNRWQPWEYQFILVTFVFCSIHQIHIRTVLLFMLFGIYTYSGISKFNPGFLKVVWNNMIIHRFFKIHLLLSTHSFLYLSGYLLALTETLIGVGLLFKSTRKLSAILLIGMHVFNLIILGPLGLNFNKVVWGWNLLMIYYLYILFLSSVENSFYLKEMFKGWKILIVLLFGVMPSLNYLGYWDNYLSFGLFSGKQSQILIGIKEDKNAKLMAPYYTKAYTKYNKLYKRVINLQEWSYKELSVPPYPEQRVYDAIQQEWLKRYPDAKTDFIVLKSY